MPNIHLVSVNIEGHRHLHQRVLPFLTEQQPDVVCLQEVFEVDVPLIKQVLNMEGQYQAMANVQEVNEHQTHALGRWGLLQLSRFPVVEQHSQHYVGNDNRVPPFMEGGNPNAMNRLLIWQTLQVSQTQFTIGTTHFTWSVHGEPTDEQQRDLQVLFSILDTIPEIVFCGDFNAPRGKRTFSQLAERYKDNIPPEVSTSIDGSLHKAGQLNLMVDGLFSTPEYKVTEVEVVGGVSDHKAISAVISKT